MQTGKQDLERPLARASPAWAHAQALVRCCGERGQNVQECIAVLGHSLGGATTIAITADDPRRKVMVAMVPGTAAFLRDDFLARAKRVKVPALIGRACPGTARGVACLRAASSPS